MPLGRQEKADCHEAKANPNVAQIAQIAHEGDVITRDVENNHPEQS